MMLFTTIGLLVLILSLVLIRYFWQIQLSYNYFKDRSIPTPPFSYFFGHYKTLWSTSFLSRQYQNWTRQLGSIYGLYEGTRPVYVVSNVEFLQEVFVKQFSCFHSRRLPFITRLSHGNHVHLFAAQRNRWRRQRHVINPTFTNAKLKLTSPLVTQCIDLFMEQIQKHEEKQFNIYELYQRLTMDVICRCAFGIDTDVQHNPKNPFLLKSAKFFEDNHEKVFLIKLSYLMPWLIPFLTQIIRIQMMIFKGLRSIAPHFMNHFEEFPGFWIINQAEHTVNERVTDKRQQHRIDLLQLMLDVATSNDVQDNDDEYLMSKSLHYDEVSSNVFLFMIAGYETTATTLAYCTYILASKPDIQKKLQEEIDHINDKEISNYEVINNLIYLDLFLREVLRMFPVAIQAISRECNQNTNVCGHKIQKGSVIQADVYSLHYDQDLWGPEDPQLFLPERHLIRRHPMAFMTFGQGPRNCIGMRFGLMEIKLCLTRLLRHQRILPGDKLEENFRIRESLVIQPNALFIHCQKRE